MIFDDDTGEVLDYNSQQVRANQERWATMQPTQVAQEVMLEAIAKGLQSRKPNLNGLAAMLKLYMSHHNIEQGSQIDTPITMDASVGVISRMRHLQDMRLKGEIKSEQFRDMMQALRSEIEYAKLPIMEEYVMAIERETKISSQEPMVIEYREERDKS